MYYLAVVFQRRCSCIPEPVPTAYTLFAVLQGAQLTALLDISVGKPAYSAAVHNTDDDFASGRHLADTSF